MDAAQVVADAHEAAMPIDTLFDWMPRQTPGRLPDGSRKSTASLPAGTLFGLRLAPADGPCDVDAQAAASNAPVAVS